MGTAPWIAVGRAARIEMSPAVQVGMGPAARIEMSPAAQVGMGPAGIGMGSAARIGIGATPWLVLQQPPQARAGALGDLAVLLEGPPEPLAELGALHS